MKTTIIFLLFFFLCHTGYVRAQKPEDCREQLIKYIADVTQIKRPEGKKIYRLKYSMQTIFRPGSDNKNENVIADVVLSKDRNFYESNVISMYTDDKNGFLVMPRQRQIIWGPGGQMMTAQENSAILSSFQDSLVRYGTIMSCRDIKTDSVTMRETIMSPPDGVKKNFKVDKIALYFDVTSNTIKRATCFFASESDVDRIIVNYELIDFDYKGKFNESAFDKVFLSKGKLKPAYKDYELIDNRSQN